MPKAFAWSTKRNLSAMTSLPTKRRLERRKNPRETPRADQSRMFWRSREATRSSTEEEEGEEREGEEGFEEEDGVEDILVLDLGRFSQEGKEKENGRKITRRSAGFWKNVRILSFKEI